MQGVAGSLTTKVYPRKFVFEQNLANPHNIYLLKNLGHMVSSTNPRGNHSPCLIRHTYPDQTKGRATKVPSLEN